MLSLVAVFVATFFLVVVVVVEGLPLNVVNPSFENQNDGWAAGWTSSAGKTTPSIAKSRRDEVPQQYAICKLSTRNAAPDGIEYASISAGSNAITQTLSTTIQAGKTYTMTVYSRGLNRPWGGVGTGQTAVTARSQSPSH